MKYRIFQALSIVDLETKTRAFILANNTFEPVSGINFVEETGRIVFFQVLFDTFVAP